MSAPPDPLSGRTIGRVRLQSRLGAGAMGLVYKGWHEGLNREVAVKFLTATSTNSRERFLREGQAAAKVDHPHVVHILDAGEVEGRLFLVLEYIQGRSLGELLDAQRANDQQQQPAERPVGSLSDIASICRLSGQIAEGLAAIHAAGFVHRDVKPDNIMVAGDGTAKVTDLGLVKQVDSIENLKLTGTGMVVGTPLYVSPEAIRDPGQIGPPADVYGFGATVYQLLAGAPPFVGSTPYDVLRSHLEEKPRPLSELRNDVPAGLDALVLRCLAKAPDKRPSAAEVVTALRQAGGQRASLRSWPITVTIAGLAVATLGAAWWFVRVPAVSGVVAIIGPDAGRILVTTAHPRTEARLDQGPWQPLPAAGIPARPGRHVVELRAAQDGPTLTFRAAVEVGVSATAAVMADLQRTTLATTVRQAVPGEGMAFIDGVAFGTDAQVALRFAGTYQLGRWSGTSWTSQRLVVEADGSSAADPPQSADAPDGPAWWRAIDDDGLPSPSHHLLSWWEAEHLRQGLAVPAPPGWPAQGEHPEQPAQEFGPLFLPALLRAIDSARLGALPDAALALRLAKQLRNPVWSLANQRLDVVGGIARGKAYVVLVPATAKARP